MNQSINPIPSSRLLSLDAFRGFAIAGMLFVNNPGTWNADVVPYQLLHAQWHGCTFADLIFPFFLFIVGVAMPISYAKKSSLPAWQGVMIAARRALVLYLLGAFLKSASINEPVLHFGILQRIGILYFAAYLLLPLGIKTQAIIAGAMLFVWWGLMAFVSAPGVITGSFERDVNIAQYIDSFILAPEDKETIVSMIPGLSTVLFGVLTGRMIQKRKNDASVVRNLLIAGAAGITIGLLWDQVVPLNKILWTSSFAVYTAGWSCLVLGAMYWLVEVKKMSRAAFPLIVFGMNAITVYVGTGLFVRWIMLSWKVPYDGAMTSLTGFFFKTFSSITTPTIGSLLYSSLIIGLGWIVCYWMYQKKIILKV
jgi:predicted acyltransferase